jgi:hypothetical protein
VPHDLVCPQCDKAFTVEDADYKRRMAVKKRGLFCSHVCAGARATDGHMHTTYVPLVCANPLCGKKFTLRSGIMRARAKKSRHPGRHFCGRDCAKLANMGNRLKRKPYWSDETWKWEKLLSQEHLGMGAGEKRWLLYGHEFNFNLETTKLRKVEY